MGGSLETGRGLGAKARVFPGPELPRAAGPPGKETHPGGREGAAGEARAPNSSGPPGDSSPPPSTGCFHSVLTSPFLSPVPDCGGGGGTRRGVSGGRLPLVAFQNPRLSLAHLSFGLAAFSALGSGCISRKLLGLGWEGRSPGSSAPPLTAPPPPRAATMVSSFAEAAATES